MSRLVLVPDTYHLWSGVVIVCVNLIDYLRLVSTALSEKGRNGGPPFNCLIKFMTDLSV